MHELRRTGRTTRMIREANRLAGEGKSVWVVFASKRHLDHMRSHLAVGANATYAGDESIDWDLMTIIGVDLDSVVLFDHHVIELKYAKQLKMLHMFDVEPKGAVWSAWAKKPTT